MNYLDDLENKAISAIQEAHGRFRDIALLWPADVNSTVLLWIAPKAFGGKLPVPAVFIDTGFMFEEMCKFRDKYSKKWGLNLIIGRNEKALEGGVNPKRSRTECCRALRDEALRLTLEKHSFKALLSVDDRGSESSAGKEAASGSFSRIYPLSDWKELDIWRYVQKENIPVVELYFANGGKRYRNIDCAACSAPIASKANNVKKIIKELESTEKEKSKASGEKDDQVLERLKSLGYI